MLPLLWKVKHFDEPVAFYLVKPLAHTYYTYWNMFWDCIDLFFHFPEHLRSTVSFFPGKWNRFSEKWNCFCVFDRSKLAFVTCDGCCARRWCLSDTTNRDTSQNVGSITFLESGGPGFRKTDRFWKNKLDLIPPFGFVIPEVLLRPIQHSMSLLEPDTHPGHHSWSQNIEHFRLTSEN